MEATGPVLRRCGRTPAGRRPDSSPKGFTVAGQRRIHTGLRFTLGAGNNPGCKRIAVGRLSVERVDKVCSTALLLPPGAHYPPGQ